MLLWKLGKGGTVGPFKAEGEAIQMHRGDRTPSHLNPVKLSKSSCWGVDLKL
ncbi:hypothetical protein NG799_09965 [Laspinema sp. D1]|uniref:Uncharacterized protein n=1 Tax=Laspinema palackyanum D2a TaxID=2953684 RepID=A0ABT2MPH3_9CYAN|nr:hypothetical protein [Laspinema sp. D2b]MCT7966656.1 hypothetical protein [Laspinema sp. D2a]